MRGRRRRKLILTLAKLMIISTRRQGQARILSLRNLTDRCQKFTILVTPSGQAGETAGQTLHLREVSLDKRG